MKKEKILDLYSKILIIDIDLRKELKNCCSDNVDNSNFEAYLIYSFNKSLLDKVFSSTTSDTHEVNRLKGLQKENDNLLKKIIRESTSSWAGSWGLLRKLHLKITLEIDNLIKYKKLKSTTSLTKQGDGSKQDRHVGQEPQSTIKSMLVIVDEINLPKNEDDITNISGNLEEKVESFFLNTVFIKRPKIKSILSPTNIQYIFCSILPLCFDNSKYTYPTVTKFAKFNVKNLSSFGEFHAKNLYKLIFNNENSSSNLQQLINMLMTNKKDMTPFLESGLLAGEVEKINMLWKARIKKIRNFMLILKIDRKEKTV